MLGFMVACLLALSGVQPLIGAASGSISTTWAIGLALPARGGVAQVSTNVEDHLATPLATLLAAVERHAPVSEAELVGLAPRAAFEGFPPGVPVRNRAFVEDHLAASEVT